MNIEEFHRRKAEAGLRVALFDRVDGRMDREPKTICAALEAGIRNPEGGSQFDALVMIEDLGTALDRLRKNATEGN